MVGFLGWIKLKVVVLLLGLPVLVLCWLGTAPPYGISTSACVRRIHDKTRWMSDSGRHTKTRRWPHLSNNVYRSTVVRPASTKEEDASLEQRRNDSTKEETNVSGNRKTFSISYVGRGSSAIVRKGSLLVAPSQEYHHLLSKAAIFIYDVGLADDNSEELVARGVIIDHPTAFSVSEMIDESFYFPSDGVGSAAATLRNNTLFRGGDLGEELVMMLHSLHQPSQVMIGSSGIYQGGLSNILEAINQGQVGCDSVKFFFNYLEFTETQLNLMFHDNPTNQPGSVDSWISVEVPSHFILHNDYSRGSAWEMLRNYIRSNNL